MLTKLTSKNEKQNNNENFTYLTKFPLVKLNKPEREMKREQDDTKMGQYVLKNRAVSKHTRSSYLSKETKTLSQLKKLRRIPLKVRAISAKINY